MEKLTPYIICLNLSWIKSGNKPCRHIFFTLSYHVKTIYYHHDCLLKLISEYQSLMPPNNYQNNQRLNFTNVSFSFMTSRLSVRTRVWKRKAGEVNGYVIAKAAENTVVIVNCKYYFCIFFHFYILYAYIF